MLRILITGTIIVSCIILMFSGCAMNRVVDIGKEVLIEEVISEKCKDNDSMECKVLKEKEKGWWIW